MQAWILVEVVARREMRTVLVVVVLASVTTGPEVVRLLLLGSPRFLPRPLHLPNLPQPLHLHPHCQIRNLIRSQMIPIILLVCSPKDWKGISYNFLGLLLRLSLAFLLLLLLGLRFGLPLLLFFLCLRFRIRIGIRIARIRAIRA
jgi:hypothetical protein